jgi:hypothetical protein
MSTGRTKGGGRSLWNAPANRALLLGWLSLLPLLVWWVGWFPGFLSSDSIDQLGQVARFDFHNLHPISHTFSVWVVTRVWDHPGAVTLVQVLILAGLLGYTAKRVTEVGVPWWLAAAAAWITAAVPMVAATTITIWKDVPYSLALLWAFAELILLARDRSGFWAGRVGPARLGVALGMIWVLRPNGFITVLLLVLVIAIGFRHQWRRWLPMAAVAAGIGVLLPALLLRVLPATSTAIEPAEVFMPDVAAVVVHDRAWFDAADLQLVEAVGALRVWDEYYQCSDSTPLLFHPEFDTGVARDDPWAYRGLVARSTLSHLPTVAGHRWCVGSFLVWPVQPAGTFLHRPPFEIPPNTLGIARSSISDRAYAFTLAQYQWIERDGVIWFTWRPALVILAAIATYAAIALRRRLHPLLWGGALGAAQLVNVAATVPAQEFRYALGLYLMGLMSLPLWWLIVRPRDSRIATRDPA